MTETKNPSAIYSQTQIQKALLRLMKKNRYENLTVKEILYEAKIARKTFYRNFTSKADVMDSLVKKTMTQYTQKLLQLENENLDLFFDAIFDVVKSNRSFFKLLSRNNLLHLILEELNTYIPVIHDMYFSDCSFFKTLSKQQITFVIAFNIGAIWNVISRWIQEDMKTPKEEIKTGLVKYLSTIN